MLKKCTALFFAFLLICIGISSCVREESTNRIVSERFIVQIDFSSWIQKSFRVSPDSRRVAYAAKAGNKWFVVVDGKEEKQYDGIVTLGGGRVIFDSPDSLHYLAFKGSSIYLVEERIRQE
ncbi:MAG TPA: hypothetical protein ENN22_15225 [bacterium]|nr:hypothetical protein [bacterium]